MTSIRAPTPADTPAPPALRESASRRRTRARMILLGCGILSGVLYFAGDVLMSAVYPGYSSLHRTVSELNAIGAPTRDLSIAFGLAGYLLLIPFGAGVWQSAAGNRRLRVAGVALAMLGISGLWGVTLASMQPPGTEQPASHAVSAIVGLLLLVTAIAFSASALGKRFRLYSVATIVVMLAFAGWAAMDATRIEEGLATPWVGVKERISFYSWHLWFIVLALVLLRQRRAANAEAGNREGMPMDVPVTTARAA
jgi:hypothetical membrane protein